MSRKKDAVAGALLGVGLAFGFIPILIACLLTKTNLFVVVIDRMDDFWKSRESLEG